MRKKADEEGKGERLIKAKGTHISQIVDPVHQEAAFSVGEGFITQPSDSFSPGSYEQYTVSLGH